MRILVTGASGFIGSRLVPFLAESGHDVVAAGRTQARLVRLGPVEAIASDLRNPTAAERFPRQVDAVIHLAQGNVPPSPAEDLEAVNTRSTATLLTYAVRAGAAAFVLASTGSIYGGSARPLREDDPPRPADAYAHSKLAAERLVCERAGDFAAFILRVFAPYGPGQRNRLVPELVERVRSHRPVRLRAGGLPRLNPIYVDHVVAVLAQALMPHDNGSTVVNVAGDEVLSIRDMAKTIGRIVGTEPVFEHLAERPPEDLVADTTLLRRRFDLPTPLISFEEGIARIVASEIAPTRP